MDPSRKKSDAVQWPMAIAICVLLTAAMELVRLGIYPHRIVPLAYTLPLLSVCWHRRRVLLWAMAAAFLFFASLKIVWLIPDQYFDNYAQQFVFVAMQWADILVPAGTLHLMLNIQERSEADNRALLAANAELDLRNEEITRQHEELQSQSEELEQQAEELRMHGVELEGLNRELETRQRTLQLLLQLALPGTSEPDLLHRICAAGPALLGSDVAAVAVLERRNAEMILRAHAEFGAQVPDVRLPAEATLAALAIERNEVAQLEDTRLRPDLRFPPSAVQEPPRSLISAPMLLRGGAVGALEAYATQSRAWTPQQVQLLEWLASQCARVWESVRLREELQREQSQLTESRRRLDLVLTSTGVGLWLNRLPLGDLNWDRRTRELFFVPPDVEPTIELFYARLHPDDREPSRRAMQTALGNRSLYAIDHRAVHPATGEVRWIRSIGRVTYAADGTPERFDGISYDISDLVAAKAAAEAANHSKGRFLANVSHELRTPMNAILGMIDLAIPKQTDPTAVDFLTTARGSADLLLALLNDLLDTAKIEAGKLELDAAPFGLRAALAQCGRVLAVRASEKGVTYSTHVPPDVPDALLGDQVRLRQILLNLAGNGIKFTERGTVSVSVRLAASEGRDVTLEFAVRDTGIGIPPAELERIFQPFTQADLTTARRFGGTGLGLTISANLVRLMHGRIWVESTQGQGSTFFFTVRLPQTDVVPAPAPVFEVAPNVVTRLRILLVEDTLANQKLASYILRKRGHLVDVAADGRQALEMSRPNCYDVILMDVQMPGMDGLEATARLRSREPHSQRVPIIAMTAHAMAGDRDRCLAAGMDAYISKPINAQEMVALVESLASNPAVSP